MKTQSILTLEDVRRMATAAEAEATRNSWAVTLATVNNGERHCPAVAGGFSLGRGGHAAHIFKRQDGLRFHSLDDTKGLTPKRQAR